MLQVTFNALFTGSLYALLALSFSVATSTSRFFNIAHGAAIAIGAYIALATVTSVGPFMAALCGITAASLFGGTADHLVFSRIRKNQGSSLVLLLASLGLYVVIENTIALAFGTAERRLILTSNPSTFEFATIRATNLQLISIGTTAAVIAGSVVLLNMTIWGAYIRAIGANHELSRAIGIPTKQVIGSVMVCCSGLAGLAGVVSAADTNLYPRLGFDLMLPTLAATLIGGIGRPLGAVLGGLLVGVLEHATVYFASADWRDFILFLMLVVVLLIRPTGLADGVTSK